MDLYFCNETLYKEEEDDLGLGGLKSLPDPALFDQRVLENVLNGNFHSQQSEIIDYFHNGIQQQIKPHMRKIVTDWMLEVTQEEKCNLEVFSLAVNYMDRVLSQISIGKAQFQLLGSVCIFLASKFKESSPLCAEKLVICSDFSFTTEEIMKWELMVLQLLNWDLSAITPYCILDQLLRRLNYDLRGHIADLQIIRNYAETHLKNALTDSELLTTSPCLMAVSSLIAAVLKLHQKSNSCQNVVLNFLQHLLELTGIQLEEALFVSNRLEAIFQSSNQISTCNFSYSSNSSQIKSTACAC